MIGGAEQRREARAAVEARNAPPVDRALARHERGRVAVAEQGVVLERGGHGARDATSVLVRSPTPHRGGSTVASAGCRRRHLIGVDVGGSASRPRSSTSPPGPRPGAIRSPTPQPATPDAVRRRWRARRTARRRRPDRCTLPAVVVGGTVRTAAHIDDAWIGTHAPRWSSRRRRPPRARCLTMPTRPASPRPASARRAVERGVVVMVTVGTGIGTALLNDGVLVAELRARPPRGQRQGRRRLGFRREARREAPSWQQWAERVDTYLTHLHALLWPELIVIGGGVVEEGRPVHRQPRSGLRGARSRSSATSPASSAPRWPRPPRICSGRRAGPRSLRDRRAW